MELKVTLTSDEYVILESWLGIGEVEKWIQHALDNKIRQRSNASIMEHTNLNPQKLSQIDRANALSGITLPTKLEREPKHD